MEFELASLELRSNNGSLEIQCAVSPVPDCSEMRIVLIQEDAVDVYWQATFSLYLVNSLWNGRLALEPSQHRRLFRVSQIVVENASTAITPGFAFLEPLEDGIWDTGPEAIEFQQQLAAKRDHLYNVPLTRDYPSDACQVFRAVAIVEGLLLTMPQRVPSIVALPITNNSLGMDSRDILNAISPQFEIHGAIPSDIWQSHLRGRKNVTAMVISDIRSPDAESACKISQQPLINFSNLLGRRRNAVPKLLGGLIAKRSLDGTTFQYEGCWTNEPSYQGNLAGGFVSGEDQHHLLNQWTDLSNRPRAQLWLSLFQDVRSTTRWDHQFLRLFILLEAMATERFPNPIQVVDPVGNPMLKTDGRPYMTSSARGGVYQMIADLCRTGSFSESFFSTRLNSSGNQADLWEEVGVWTDLRNEVVHEGGWEVIMPPQDPGRHNRLVAELQDRSTDQSIGGGIDSILRAIRHTAEFAVDCSIRGEI